MGCEFCENAPTRYCDTEEFKNANTLLSILFFAVISFAYYLGKYFAPMWQFYDLDIQIGMLMAIIFILLYNGARGYNKKWFQIFSYLYYPLHIAVLGLIFVAIFGV